MLPTFAVPTVAVLAANSDGHGVAVHRLEVPRALAAARVHQPRPRLLLAPRVAALLLAAAGRPLPLVLARQPPAAGPAIRLGLMPGHAVDRVLAAACRRSPLHSALSTARRGRQVLGLHRRRRGRARPVVRARGVVATVTSWRSRQKSRTSTLADPVARTEPPALDQRRAPRTRPLARAGPPPRIGLADRLDLEAEQRPAARPAALDASPRAAARRVSPSLRSKPSLRRRTNARPAPAPSRRPPTTSAPASPWTA
jgi:hypothetical protein